MEKLAWVSTVVGSFPRQNTQKNMEEALKDQIMAGIDYPCYPQLVSMIDQFLEPLSKDPNTGLIKKNGKYYLDSDLNLPKEPVALEYGKFVLDFFDKNPSLKKKVKGWKAPLTGPFTLAGEIHISEDFLEGKRLMVYKEPRAIMIKSIVEKLADFMASIAKEYDKMGATIISMDEPTLSLIVGRRKIFFYKQEEIINILNMAIKNISKYSSIHICGNVSEKLRDILLVTNVKILDHEFANGFNVGIFNKNHFENKDKTLAYGCIISNVKSFKEGTINDYVEPVEIIEERIKKAVKEIGKENLIFKPDCGFGGLLPAFGENLGSEIVRKKLTNMCIAMRNLKNKL
ncbi:MAG: hypothetical protein ACTSRZ_04420 [Promethearchaeota archaeon]